MYDAYWATEPVCIRYAEQLDQQVNQRRIYSVFGHLKNFKIRCERPEARVERIKIKTNK